MIFLFLFYLFKIFKIKCDLKKKKNCLVLHKSLIKNSFKQKKCKILNIAKEIDFELDKLTNNIIFYLIRSKTNFTATLVK